MYSSIGTGLSILNNNKRGDKDNPFGLKESSNKYIDKIDHVTSILQQRLDYLIESIITLTGGMFDNAQSIREHIDLARVFINEYFIQELLFLNRLLVIFDKNRFQVD